MLIYILRLFIFIFFISVQSAYSATSGICGEENRYIVELKSDAGLLSSSWQKTAANKVQSSVEQNGTLRIEKLAPLNYNIHNGKSIPKSNYFVVKAVQDLAKITSQSDSNGKINSKQQSQATITSCYKLVTKKSKY